MGRLVEWCLLCSLVQLAQCQVRQADDLQDALQILGLTKFLQKLRDAGLGHILYNDDKYTLFAPTNEAFDRLEARVIHSKDGALTKTKLKQILLYHAAYSQWKQEDWNNDELIPTALTGMNIRVDIYQQPKARKGLEEKVITLSGVQVLSTNNRAKNGMVHVLNDVIYPIPYASAYDTLPSLPALSHFKSLLEEFNMMKTLRFDEPLTVFVPINDAFKKLPPQFMDNMAAQSSAMAAILTYHLVNGTYHTHGLFRNTRMHSLESSDIVVTGAIGDSDQRSPIQLNSDATILHSHPVTNGVLHVIDALLLPPANPKQMMYMSKEGLQYDAQKRLRRK